MKTFEYYSNRVINAPNEMLRERYRAEAFESGRFTNDELDRLARIGDPDAA